MQNKKGFTLVELLAVIIILGLVITISFTSINAVRNNSLNNLLEMKQDAIVQGAILYGQDNPEMLTIESATNDCQGNSYCTKVTVQFLLEHNYIDSEYIDEESGNYDMITDVTGESMANLEVLIYRKNNSIYAEIL